MAAFDHYKRNCKFIYVIKSCRDFCEALILFAPAGAFLCNNINLYSYNTLAQYQNVMKFHSDTFNLGGKLVQKPGSQAENKRYTTLCLNFVSNLVSTWSIIIIYVGSWDLQPVHCTEIHWLSLPRSLWQQLTDSLHIGRRAAKPRAQPLKCLRHLVMSGPELSALYLQ